MSRDRSELQSTTSIRLAGGDPAHRHFARHSTPQERALAFALPVLWTLVAAVIVSFGWWMAVK